MVPKTFQLIFKFAVVYLAVCGGLWGVTEAATYFTGTFIKDFLGDWWIVIYLVIPAIAGLLSLTGFSIIHFWGSSNNNILVQVETALNSPDPGVRKNAVDTLKRAAASSQEQIFLNRLLQNLRYPMPDVKIQVALALAELKRDKRTIPNLKYALLSNHTEFHEQAAKALATIGGLPAVEALLEVFKNGTLQACRFAIQALGEIGDNTCVPVFVETLKTTIDSGVKSDIAQAFGKFGNA